MPSPFALVAQKLFERGLSVIPIAPGTKYPGRFQGGKWAAMSGWDQYIRRIPTQLEIDAWSEWPDAGIGVCLGPISGIVALDFDSDIDGIHSKIHSVTPPSPVRKKGATGFTAFYKYTGKASFKKSINGKSVVELLSSGKQTVLPKSIHPMGFPYRWTTYNTFEHYAVADLPELPENYEELINQFFPETRKITKIRDTKVRDYYGETDPEEVKKALSYISADDYHQWIAVGMALKDGLNDQGFAPWDSWSQQSTKYKVEEMQKKWHSFVPQEIGLGSLFYYAMQGGYIPKPKYADIPLVEMELVPAGGESNKTSNLESEMLPEPATPHKNYTHLATEAPGLVGDITRWIIESAIQPQPLLALAAAIAAVGAIMAHKVRSETNLRTNMLTVSMAPSSSGKDHPRKQVIQLLHDAGLSDLHGGTPASGQGLLTSVFAGKGKRLIQIDEIGRLLKNLNSRHAASFQADILTNIMMLFSAANNIFHGTEYAHSDDLKLKRKDIEQPCLCVHGSTVPGRFYEALSSAEAIDGFLSRWLIFESHEASPKRQKPINVEPPEHLLQKIIEWNKKSTNPLAKTDFEATAYIRPGIITFSADATASLEAYIATMDARKVAAYKEGQGLDAIYGRAVEHAIKLSLCGHMDGIITTPVFQWATEVVEYCMENVLRAVKERIADSQNEADIKRVLSVFQNNGWMTHNDITRRTQWLTRQRRGEILQTLLDIGDVEGREEKTRTNIRREYKAT